MSLFIVTSQWMSLAMPYLMHIPNNIIAHCDVIMSGHCDVILIDLHWPDGSPFGDHILVYHIKSGHSIY